MLNTLLVHMRTYLYWHAYRNAHPRDSNLALDHWCGGSSDVSDPFNGIHAALMQQCKRQPGAGHDCRGVHPCEPVPSVPSQVVRSTPCRF